MIGALLVAVLLTAGGCGKSSSGDAAVPKTPQQAASQLEQVFAPAQVEIKDKAVAASQALRTSDYEKAAQALALLETRNDLTLEQGLAVHNSSIALIGKLVVAMEAGDPNAKRAYELLKAARAK